MPPQQQPPPMIIGRSPGEQQISQPPNSPTSTQQQQPKQLVDLTEGSGKDTGDEELQRAIKLSLQVLRSHFYVSSPILELCFLRRSSPQVPLEDPMLPKRTKMFHVL